MLNETKITFAIVSFIIFGVMSAEAQNSEADKDKFGKRTTNITQVAKTQEDKNLEKFRQTSLGLMKSTKFFSGGSGSEVVFDSDSAHK